MPGTSTAGQPFLYRLGEWLERTFLRWQIGLVFYSLMSVPLAVGALAAAWRRRWLVALGVGALDGFYIVCAAATLIYGRARSGEV